MPLRGVHGRIRCSCLSVFHKSFVLNVNKNIETFSIKALTVFALALPDTSNTKNIIPKNFFIERILALCRVSVEIRDMYL